ncbi:MAG TPA: hypothetical protein VFC78_01220 [Tepidisphaeraceae bacterium]|nr:hypothetical protein [Tepidisphaeraceae bacterium]
MENPKLTADFVIRMAMVVRAKEEAGESIDTISADMLDALRRVAYGQLSAKIYVLSLGWAHWSRSVSAISRLVLPDQERIAENGYLDIFNLEEATTRRIPITEITLKQLKQAIDDNGHLRSILEQENWLRSRAVGPSRSNR